MSYGFIFNNNSGETVIDDTSVKPWFWGQAAAQTVQDITSSYNRINEQNPAGETIWSPIVAGVVESWTVYNIKYYVPTAFSCFIVYTLPDNNSVYYSCPKPYHIANQGASEVNIIAFVPSTHVASVADIPKVYIFITDPIPANLRGTDYGIQVFTQDGLCTFDSSVRHFQPFDIQYVYIPNPNDYVYTQSNIIPDQQVTLYDIDTIQNPAFLLPSVDIINVAPEWEADNYALVNTAAYSKLHPTLYISVPRTYYQLTPYGTPAGFYNLAAAGLQPYIIVNGDLYDQGLGSPALPQSFTLSKNKAGVVEGETGVVITLDTTAVPNGTIVPYTISGTGITASDFTVADLTREFIVTDNTSNTYIQAALDAFSEGTQTATLALDNGKASINFTISEAVSYSLSSFMTPEEGQSIAVTLTTSNLPDGSTVPYVITGITSADLTVGTLTGNFTITSGTSALEFRFARDSGTESETMHISVNNGATFLDIPITDVPPGNEVLTISPSTFSYAQHTTITITGGTPNGSFEFLNVAQGVDPVYAWNNRWKPEYATTVGTQYFDENGEFSNPPVTALGPSGSDLGGSTTSTVNRTFWIFNTTTKNFRSFNYTINPEQEFFVSGTDNTQGPLTVNEGTTGYFKVTTANVPNGTVVYPKLINTNLSASDYTNTGASGITIQNNVATFQITFAADLYTDGQQESGELVVQYPNGTTKNSYGTIYVNDTSVPLPSYSVSRYVATVNENGFQFFTIGLSNVPVGTQLWWDISGTGITTNDIQYVYHDAQDGNGWFVPSGGSTLNNTFTTDSSTTYQVIIYPKSDAETEGTETATFKLRTGWSQGNVEASVSFDINDTSTAPVTTYNEILTVKSDAYQDYIVELGNYMTISVTGGKPNGTFQFQITDNGAAEPTVFTGTGSLTATGTFTNYITGAEFQGSETTGDRKIWYKFNYNGNVRSARVRIVENAGTLSGGEYCTGTTLYQNYFNGHGGTYAQVVQLNSPTCGATPQYNPVTDASTYYYYLSNNTRDTFTVTGARPSATVRFQITSGIYAGVYWDRTSNASGTATYTPDVGAYAAGTYSGTVTFPNQDAYYPAAYRSLPVTWIVQAASAPTTLTVTNYSFTKTAGWENNIDVYGSPSAAYDGLRVRGTDSVTGDPVNSIDKQVTRTFTTNIACTISYRLTVSSEPLFDFGYFYIDGVEKIKRAGLDVMGGEEGTGTYATMALAAGTHTIKVRYTKDGSATNGGDNAFGEYSLAV